MELYKPLRPMIRDTRRMNVFLAGLTPDKARMLRITELDSLLSPQFKIMNDVLDFGAFNTFNAFADKGARIEGAKVLHRVMANSWSKSPEMISERAFISTALDPFLPPAFRIMDIAKTYTTAQALHKSAMSLLRARFLANALIAGTGLTFGGPAGAVGTLSMGLALQNPALLRQLIRLAGKGGATGGRIMPRVAGVAQRAGKLFPKAQGIPRQGTSEVISQLLRMTNQR